MSIAFDRLYLQSRNATLAEMDAKRASFAAVNDLLMGRILVTARPAAVDRIRLGWWHQLTKFRPPFGALSANGQWVPTNAGRLAKAYLDNPEADAIIAASVSEQA